MSFFILFSSFLRINNCKSKIEVISEETQYNIIVIIYKVCPYIYKYKMDKGAEYKYGQKDKVL